LVAVLVGLAAIPLDAKKRRSVALGGGAMVALYAVVFAPIGGILFLPSATCLLLAGRKVDPA
jgi:hypothetical protein